MRKKLTVFISVLLVLAMFCACGQVSASAEGSGLLTATGKVLATELFVKTSETEIVEEKSVDEIPEETADKAAEDPEEEPAEDEAPAEETEETTKEAEKLDLSTLKNSIFTISEEGTYELSGKLEGQIVVDADKDAKVKLILDSVEISNKEAPAIYVNKAGKLIIETADNSKNIISSSGAEHTDLDAAIYADCKLTLKGDGILKVVSRIGHGILAKDDITVKSGSIAVEAAQDGFNGKKDIKIKGGSLTISAYDDGIHADNELNISDGEIVINESYEGLEGLAVIISGGSIDIVSSDDGINAAGGKDGSGTEFDDWTEADWEEYFKDWDNNSDFESYFDEDFDNWTDEDWYKFFGEMFGDGWDDISGYFDSFDDYSDYYDYGDFDGFYGFGNDPYTQPAPTAKPKKTAMITRDSMPKQNDSSQDDAEGNDYDFGEFPGSGFGGGRPEGMPPEGFGGGHGGPGGPGGFGRENPFAVTEGAKIVISGGEIKINALGDGIDSNGSLEISGGELYISGPTSPADSAVDYASDGIISGGTVIAAGSSGMAEGFGKSSTQASILYNFDSEYKAGSEIALNDEKGNVLISYKPENDFSSVVVSAPDLESAGTYYLTVDEDEYEIEMDGVVYSNGRFGMGGKSGDIHRPGDMKPPEDFEPDEDYSCENCPENGNCQADGKTSNDKPSNDKPEYPKPSSSPKPRKPGWRDT